MEPGDEFSDLTVREHLEFMARAHGNDDPDQVVTSVLTELALTKSADRFPFALSQGQRRRLGLASCLVRPRRLLILDEPEQNLDISGRAWLTDRIQDERAAGVAVLLASHDPALVRQVSDSVVELFVDNSDPDRRRSVSLVRRPPEATRPASFAGFPSPSAAEDLRQRHQLFGHRAGAVLQPRHRRRGVGGPDRASRRPFRR